MKLSHLSIAIFTAISLAACGGSSDNAVDNTQKELPKPKPKPVPKPEKPVTKTDDIVDPTGDDVVTHFKLLDHASQGTTQYLRNSKSKFDRKNNPKYQGAATSILGVDLNDQNPWFTNFVAARTNFKKGSEKVSVAQFLGVDETGLAGLNNAKSLQSENKKNIARLGKVTTEPNFDVNALGTPKNGKKSATGEFAKLDGVIAALQTQLKDKNLDDAQKEDYQASLSAAQVYKAELESVYKNAVKGKSDNGLFLLNAGNQSPMGVSASGTAPSSSTAAVNEIVWGDGVATKLNKPAVGLVGMNFVKQDKNGNNVANGEIAKIQGTDDKAISTSRIFGRYFLADDRPDRSSSYSINGGKDTNYNSYLRPTTYVGALLGTVNYNANKTSKENADNAKSDYESPKHGIAVKPMELQNVQYGRVTGNLNPASTPSSEQFKKGGLVEQRENFLARNDASAVNYYFYRGTNATSLSQMSALPKDTLIEYQGHALMYGIDNSYHGNGDNLPNAFGNSGAVGLGNFVVAKFDVANKKVGGVVYNAWMFDQNKAELKLDKLVNFNGKVTGNTVVGSANLAYKKENAGTADFRGSFFGDKASELGGSFNSVTWQEKYGPKDSSTHIWGGSFGAQRVTPEKTVVTKKPVVEIDNDWLGDIGANIRK